CARSPTGTSPRNSSPYDFATESAPRDPRSPALPAGNRDLPAPPRRLAPRASCCYPGGGGRHPEGFSKSSRSSVTSVTAAPQGAKGTRVPGLRQAGTAGTAPLAVIRSAQGAYPQARGAQLASQARGRRRGESPAFLLLLLSAGAGGSGESDSLRVPPLAVIMS